MADSVLDKKAKLGSHFRSHCAAFLGPHNAIREANPDLQILIYSLLLLYVGSDLPKKRDVKKVAGKRKKGDLSDVDHGYVIAEAAEALSEQLDSLFSDSGPWTSAVFLQRFRSLPLQLKQLSSELDAFLGSMARKGESSNVSRTEALVSASLLLQFETGKFRDEDLAELAQLLPRDFGGAQLPVEGSPSSGSISKSRKRFRENYPLRYLSLQQRMFELWAKIKLSCVSP